MNIFHGVVIEESLKDKAVLQKIKVVATKVEQVTVKHHTPWLSQWTLHTVEISENDVPRIATLLSNELDYSHGTCWYADLKNDTTHYIIFRNKVFVIDRRSKEQYDQAKHYGLSLGIPKHQVDFHPDVGEWKR